MLKRVFMMIFSAAMMIFLTSCRGSGEVQNRLVVHAIGIDKTDDGIKASYQIFSGKAPEGAPVDADESTVVTLTAYGGNLKETEESLRLQTGKEIFLGDAELIVVGEALADTDFSAFLDYFKRSDVYLGVNVVFCKGSAAKTLGFKLHQGAATAILLRGVVEEAVEDGRALSSRIIELSNAIDGDGETLAVPILTLDPGDDFGDGYTLTDTNIGIFSSRLVGPDGAGTEIDTDSTMGISLLKGRTKALTVTVPVGDESVTVSADHIKISRKIKIIDGAPFINVYITGKYSVGSLPGVVDEDDVRKSAEREILRLCEEGAKHINDGDLFEIGKMICKYEPDFAEDLSGDFSAIIQKTVFSVEIGLQKY